MLKDLSKELDKPKDAASSLGQGSILSPKTSAPLTPVPVEVRQPDPGALESLRSLISPLLHPLATTGIIIIFVIFILLQREDLRNRLIRLAGSHDLQRTTAALDDAAGRLSRLFLIQLVVNGAFGVVIGGSSIAHRHSERGSVGHFSCCAAFRTLHRRIYRGSIPARTCGCRRSRLVDAAMDARPFFSLSRS